MTTKNFILRSTQAVSWVVLSSMVSATGILLPLVARAAESPERTITHGPRQVPVFRGGIVRTENGVPVVYYVPGTTNAQQLQQWVNQGNRLMTLYTGEVACAACTEGLERSLALSHNGQLPFRHVVGMNPNTGQFPGGDQGGPFHAVEPANQTPGSAGARQNRDPQQPVFATPLQQGNATVPSDPPNRAGAGALGQFAGATPEQVDDVLGRVAQRINPNAQPQNQQGLRVIDNNGANSGLQRGGELHQAVFDRLMALDPQTLQTFFGSVEAGRQQLRRPNSVQPPGQADPDLAGRASNRIVDAARQGGEGFNKFADWLVAKSGNGPGQLGVAGLQPDDLARIQNNPRNIRPTSENPGIPPGFYPFNVPQVIDSDGNRAVARSDGSFQRLPPGASAVTPPGGGLPQTPSGGNPLQTANRVGLDETQPQNAGGGGDGGEGQNLANQLLPALLEAAFGNLGRSGGRDQEQEQLPQQPAALECSDAKDNDSDGKIDTDDPGCHSDGNTANSASYDTQDNRELDEPMANEPPAQQVARAPVTSQCSDDRDNDGDSLADIDDPDCHTDGNARNPSSYDPTLTGEEFATNIRGVPAFSSFMSSIVSVVVQIIGELLGLSPGRSGQ